MSSYDLSWVLSLGFQRALLCQIATIKGVRFPEGRSGGCQEFGGGGGAGLLPWGCYQTTHSFMLLKDIN